MSANDLYLTTEQDLTTVADAIRTRGGTSEALEYPDGFASAIAAIPGSAPVDEDADVIFIDYDGTVVASRTKAQINAMTSDSDLPENPTHTGLTAQGWNWTVAQLKAQLLAMPDQQVIVGQMYVTTSGATEIDIEIKERKSPKIGIAVSGTATIDWGDNTTPDVITGNSLVSDKGIEHTYSNQGEYTIKIQGTRYCLFTPQNTKAIIYKDGYSSVNENRAYSNRVKRIRIGSGEKGLSSNTLVSLSGLESISIPNNVKSIGNYCFQADRIIKGITIPNTVTKLGNYSMRYLNNLKYLSLPYSVTELGNAVFNSTDIRKIFLPNSITIVGESLFESANYLKDVILPTNLQEIKKSAFMNCYTIEKLTIPSTVTAIGNSAFGNCCGIKEYHFKPTTAPTAGTTIFNAIMSDTIIYVPYSADHSVLNAYKTASNWAEYADYMQEEPQS